MTRWRKPFVRGLIAVGFAFLLTSTILFWLPFLSLNPREETGWYYIGSGYDDGWGQTLERLKKNLSIAERDTLDQIVKELRDRPTADLFQMKAFEDVCLNDLVNCRGLESTKVKPFIEVTLAHRQMVEAREASWTANYISVGSLMMAFLALVISLLNYLRNEARKVVTK